MANSIDFSDATLLSYNVDNYFLGDGIARYGSTRRLGVEVMTHNVSGVGFNNDGVSQSWTGFSGAMANADNFGQVTVNGYDLGSGIVGSVGMTTSNPIRVGLHRVSIECPYTNENDMHNLSTSYYTGISGAINGCQKRELLRDFSENFSFEENEEGEYTHVHSISIRFEEGALSSPDDEIKEAKGLASRLFSNKTNLPTSFLSCFQGFYDSKTEDRHYYTEVYDLFTKSCSFTKSLKIEDEETDYTKKITHSLTLNANGIVSVTENCEIKGKNVNDATAYTNAVAGMATEITASATRCTNFFDFYDTNYLGPKYNGAGDNTSFASESPDVGAPWTDFKLNAQPLSLQKQFFKKKKKVSYSITYNNDPNVEDNFIHNFSMNYSEDKKGSLTITQNGRMLPYSPISKTKDFNDQASVKNHYTTIKGSFFTNAKNYYDNLKDSDAPTATNNSATNELIDVSSSVSFPRVGRELSYTKQYSDALALRGGYTTSTPDSTTGVTESAASRNIKRMEVTVSDTAPALIRSTYMIPNKSDAFQLIHEPREAKGKQTNMGKRSVDVRAQISREAGKNVFTDIPSLTVQLNYLKKLALIKAADVAIDFKLTKFDWFVNSCTYSFASDRELSFRLNATYATKSNKEYSNTSPTIIDTP